MKTPLKYLTIAGLTLAALTLPLLKVNATEVEDEHETPEDIDAREAYRRLQLQDENGQIPPDAWINAYAEKERMPFLPEAWSEFSTAAQLEAGIVGGSWTSIGPGNIGGRIRSIIVKPGGTPDTRTIWAGAVAGGVWKSTNSGMTWTTNTDFLANTAVNCLAIDPGNSNILYAGTGEGFAVHDAVTGNGIFRTLDGGDNWEQLPSTRNNPDFAFVNRLAISPNDSWLLLAAVRVEPPAGNPFGKILRSINGGATWTTTLTSSTMADVRFQPDGWVANIPGVPGINCLASTLDGHVYYSTDQGATWTTRPDNLGISSPAGFARVELAYSRSNPLIVYASKAYGSGTGGELFRSEDGGFSFTSRGQMDPDTKLKAYNNVLWVDPFDPETVVVGGVFMYRTTDGGSTWVHAGSGTHLDHHALVEDPAYDHETPSNRRLYGGNDGGVHRTADILAQSPQWTSLNNSLSVTQFYGAAGHNATGTIIGGTQDNGTVRFHPPLFDPEDWNTMAYGDGGYCAVDQSASPYFYGENVNLQVYRSTVGGGGSGYKWEYIWGGEFHPNGIPTGECGNVPCANFIAPFMIDPNLDEQNEQKTLLAGGRSLWRTTNARVTATEVAWTEVKPRYPQNCVFNCVDINAVAVAEGDSNIIWVGDNIGSVFYTTNGTASSPTWNPGDPNNLLPGGQPFIDERICTRITIGQLPATNDPQIVAERTIYATFGGFFPSLLDPRGNVWKRDINGNWTPIHNNLPSAPVFSLVISPSNPDFLYVGTEVGVFASSDGGRNWSPAFGGSSAGTLIYSLVSSASSLSSPDIIYAGTEEGVFASKDDGETWSPGFGGPANTRVAELFWMVTGQTRQLVVATHGRGMFTLAAGD